MKKNGKTTVGQAADTDTLVASANAYINALNKMIIKRKRNFAPENTEIKQNLKKKNERNIDGNFRKVNKIWSQDMAIDLGYSKYIGCT